MRRPYLGMVVATSVFFLACSEQPTAPPDRQSSAPISLSAAVCSDASAGCIQSLINALFPAGDLLKSANDFWTNVQTKVKQGRLADAQAKATDLVNFGLKNFYAGKLRSGSTKDNLIALTSALYQYSGMTNAPTLPLDALNPDGAAAVITPTSPTTTVVTGTKQAGVIVPSGSVQTTTLVTISRLPDSPGPLFTTLNQYPTFYEFGSTSGADFSKPVTTGVCQTATFDATTFSRLRLAHNVGPNFGDVQILPRVNAPFLDCTNASSLNQLGRLGSDLSQAVVLASWGAIGRSLAPIASAVFLPDQLHATMLSTCCLGGSATKFSPFGAVDPASNPATLDYNPTSGTFDGITGPTGSNITPVPSVKVKRQDGTPVPNWPVDFAITAGGGTLNNAASTATVFTGADGIASLTSWTLGTSAGTNTVTATPRPVAQVGSPGTQPYKPAGAFSPSARSFTATAVAASDAGVISNGTLQLGVNPAGNLIVLNAGSPSLGTGSNNGTSDVGLRYGPTNAEALAIADLSEGWGVSYSSDGGETHSSGYANRSDAPIESNIVRQSFSRTPSQATSVVKVGPLQITHDFAPTELSPNLYGIAIRIENISAQPVSDVIYRRLMDWDIEPTAFSELVSLVGTQVNPSITGSNNGFASADPLSNGGNQGTIGEGNFADFFRVGPFDQGAVLDLHIPAIAAGANKTFTLYYGAAPSRADAATTAALVSPNAVSLASPANPEPGTPNTFIFAVSNFAANTLTASQIDPPVTGGASPLLMRQGTVPAQSAQEQRARAQGYGKQ